MQNDIHLSRRSNDLLGRAALSVTETSLDLPGVFGTNKLVGAGAGLTRVSPATGLTLFSAREATAAQIQEAVAAAQLSFDRGDWSNASGRERSDVLNATADILAREAGALAETIVLETGKPISEARGEVGTAIDNFRFCAGLARDLFGRTVRDLPGMTFAFTVREPAGVVATIIPWNFPLAILTQKAPAALAAGCPCVVKPSPLAPLSSLAVTAAFREAGGPAEAFIVVLGGAETGAALVSHPAIRVVSFTGSTAVGKDIAQRAHQHRFKHLVIEAGGKNAAIVLADAALDQAVEACLAGAFFNQGEVCAATSKLLVERSISDEFTERLVARADGLRVGDPFDSETQMGPLISADHHDGVVRMLRQGLSGGARCRTQRVPDSAEAMPGGPYLLPQVLDQVTQDNPLSSVELFGPVTVVQPIEGLEEAIARCNASEYGLGAALWTQDLQHALEGASRLRVGTVWVNGALAAMAELPFGGGRNSGVARELGREGLEAFTELKTVQISDPSQHAWYPETR